MTVMPLVLQDLVLPSKVQVAALISGRYQNHPNPEMRPTNWSERKSGIDIVQLVDGRQIKLVSDGQQSPPTAGWVLMLEKGSEQTGYEWTLYGIRPVDSNKG